MAAFPQTDRRPLALSLRTTTKEQGTRPPLKTLLLSLLLILAHHSTQLTSNALKANKASDLNLLVKQPQTTAPRDIRWPLRQVNVLVDQRSLNESERSILDNVFQQLEHKTCLHIHLLSSDKVNPFGVAMQRPNQLDKLERNFIYIFKSQLNGGAGASSCRHPAIGLSSLGCVRQGRQSLVLTDFAFKWPELVLRYHIMRSLGIDKLERPHGQVRRLLNMLPLSQKITSDEFDRSRESSVTKPMQPTSSGGGGATYLSQAGTNMLESSIFESPSYFAYSTSSSAADLKGANEPITAPASSSLQGGVVRESGPPIIKSDALPVQYLSEGDLNNIKELYNCSDYQNRLSPKPMDAELLAADTKQKQASEQTPLRSGPIHEPKEQLFKKSLAEEKLEASDESLSSLLKAHKLDKLSEQDSPGEPKMNESLVQEAAKHIVDDLRGSDYSAQDSDSNGANSSTSLSLGKPRECKQLESCPLEEGFSGNPSAPLDANGNSIQERPMLLKLDEFHAQDPQLRQANQMKLSQLSNDTLATYRLMNNPANLADLWMSSQQQQQQGYSLNNKQQWQPQQQQQSNNSNNNQQKPTSEMLISFEQSNSPSKDPITPQVLKLCSCTCQTMIPSRQDGQQQPSVTPTTMAPTLVPQSECPWPPQTTRAPATTTTTTMSTISTPPGPFTFAPSVTPAPTGWPTYPTGFPTYPPIIYPTIGPSIPTDGGNGMTLPHCDDDDEECYYKTTPYPPWNPVTLMPWPPATSFSSQVPSSSTTTPRPTEWSPEPTTRTTTTTTTTRAPETTQRPEPTTELPSTSAPDNQRPSSTTSIPDHTQLPLLTANACEEVEWVKPNKTVYASARIVWDVDRGNQNYFLCNNQMNGELVPGKTHGFYCKISQEGKSYETHNFNVLTKPEHVNLAWVQRNSSSFGRTNFPVVGGYSKGQQEPYIVSRCLVKDENNDIITLIGYINNQGVGWFPFDDIQIECSQYDVLACVN